MQSLKCVERHMSQQVFQGLQKTAMATGTNETNDPGRAPIHMNESVSNKMMFSGKKDKLPHFCCQAVQMISTSCMVILM